MKNINLSAQPNNFKGYPKRLIFQITLLGAIEVLI